MCLCIIFKITIELIYQIDFHEKKKEEKRRKETDPLSTENSDTLLDHLFSWKGRGDTVPLAKDSKILRAEIKNMSPNFISEPKIVHSF